MMVNPMERWQTEGQAAQVALNEAKNYTQKILELPYWKPKILYLHPEQFGGTNTKELNFSRKL